MGEELVKIFEIVERFGGYDARIKLAEKTGFSKVKASEIEDTPENVEAFKRLASQILGKNIDDLE